MVGGYRHLREVAAWNREVHDAVHRELGAGRLPILLGGDHSLSHRIDLRGGPPLPRDGHVRCACSGSTRTPTSIPANLTPSGSLHGMPVAVCAASGRASCVQIGGVTPAIRPQWVRQIGIRSVDAGERRFVHEQELEVFDMRCIDEMGMRQRDGDGARRTWTRTPICTSASTWTVLDPEIAPGVGTTVPGGMSYREAQLCMEMIADTGLVGSLDIMELNPALDVRNKTAVLAVDLVESLFGKSTLMRRPAGRARA